MRRWWRRVPVQSRRGPPRSQVGNTWRDRAALGEALATERGSPGADGRLIDLLLDEDTAVTFRTAVALLEQRDERAVRLIVTARRDADDSRSDWIGDAFRAFLAAGVGEDEDFLRRSLDAIAEDADPTSAGVARALAEWLQLT